MILETVANYDYGPFGEVIRATGPMAKLNPFRFSSKYDDDETDLLYYGHRYYNPSTGRWLSRDPAQERGGPNQYAFVGNNGISHFDELGLLTEPDIDKAFALISAQVNGKSCCCDHNVPWSLTLTGMASRSTVTLTAHTPTPSGCLLSINDYFWWNCFQAQNDYIANGGSSWQIINGNNVWKSYGFYLGTSTDIETHTGSRGPIDSLFDAGHWAFDVTVFYTMCVNGKQRLYRDTSSPDTQFTWNVPIIGVTNPGGETSGAPIYGPGYWVPD